MSPHAQDSALSSFNNNGAMNKSNCAENHESVAFNAFPTLPSGSYYPRPTETIISWLPNAGRINDDSITTSTILQLSWALVIASFTDSADISFGLRLEQPVDTSGQVFNFAIRIEGECTADEVLASINQPATALPSCCKSGTTAYRLPNLLAIYNHAEQAIESVDSVQVIRRSCDACALLITAAVLERGIQLCVRFDPDVLSRTMGQIVLNQLAHVVNRMRTEPREKLKNLCGISPDGLERVREWNHAFRLHRKASCIHEVIANKCRERPSAPAICAWDGNLSYSELETLSTSLARRLIMSSDQQEFVGLFLGKSMWTAVSMLGVMKAGKAFVLLDPSLPDHRLRTLCQISQASFILTSSKESTRALHLGPPLVIIESEFQGSDSDTLSLPTVNPHQPAYAAFTSGSSGEPKGVVVDHSAVCSGIDAYCACVGLNRQSRVFQFASYSFTISVVDHFIALMCGACLCIPSSEQLKNSLLDTIVALKVDWITITPSVARALNPNSIPALKTLCLAGESLTRSDLDKWLPYVDLKSIYGQSENTLAALVDTKNGLSSPCDLGYAFAANCWIVNSRDHHCLVPVGAEGELVIEAPTMAKGYLNNEEQTRLAFIENPNWLQDVRPGANGRFLKTGDIVRWRPEDGSIQYVGRTGTQVKLRGQRVELAEVEFHLKKGFQEANTVVAEIVVRDEERTHDALLVAFIGVVHGKNYNKGSDDESIFGATSAKFARQTQQVLINLHKTLPEYMIPTTFLPLNVLPLTPSGKLNRRLLRNKAAELGSKLPAYHMVPRILRQPSTDAERVLQQICANILQLTLEDINMDSTFFEIGGTSISTMQLVSQAHESGLSFNVSDVYRQHSLAILARHQRPNTTNGDRPADQSTSTSSAALKVRAVHSMSVPIDSEDIQDIFPCTETQQWMLRNDEGGYFLLHFTGHLDSNNLQTAFQRLLQCHTALRSIFVSIDKSLYQVVLNNMEPTFLVHQCHRNQDPASIARTMCTVDEDNLFPVGIPPLQFTLVRGHEMEHVLVIRLSHAQYDGICQHHIVSDLCAFYQDSNNPVVPSNFALYAQQIALRQTPEAMTFWRNILQGSAMPSRFRFNESNNSPKNTLLRCSVDVSAPEPPNGIFLATLIKAAWSYVLRDLTGDDDIIFGQLTNVRGMDMPNIYRTVGPCYNILPVRAQYQSLSTIYDLILALQDQHIRSIPFEASEWDHITSKSTGWPSNTRPQSIFVHQDFPKTIDISMDNLQCQLSDYIPKDPIDMSLDLYSEPRNGKLSLTLISSDHFIKKRDMESVLEKLCHTIAHFAIASECGLDNKITGFNR